MHRAIPTCGITESGEVLYMGKERIDPVYDLDHERLHRGVRDARELRPGNFSIRCDHLHVSEVARKTVRRFSCMKFLKLRIAYALLDECQCYPACRPVGNCFLCHVINLGYGDPAYASLCTVRRFSLDDLGVAFDIWPLDPFRLSTGSGPLSAAGLVRSTVQLVLDGLGRREGQLLGRSNPDGRASRWIATFASRGFLNFELAEAVERNLFAACRGLCDCGELNRTEFAGGSNS